MTQSVKPTANRVKITVLKKLSSKDVFGDSPPMGENRFCTTVKVGQEFICEMDGKMPEGFCTPAWVDIYRYVAALRFGANFSWMNEEGTNIACCTDALRPVIFELRRIK